MLIKSLLVNLVEIFYPRLCTHCKKQLLKNEFVLCAFCRHDLPLIEFSTFNENKIIRIFYGRIPVQNAFALLYFRKRGIAQNLIHDLKYKNNEEIGIIFGNWIGKKLKNVINFQNIDCIIPVPIDRKRLKKRGYNQLTKFGERLSFHLNSSFVPDKLLKITVSETQTFKNRLDRFSNLEKKFKLVDISFFDNKHVLLIDDVITTGATLEACAKQLLKANNCKISFITIAYTE